MWIITEAFVWKISARLGSTAAVGVVIVGVGVGMAKHSTETPQLPVATIPGSSGSSGRAGPPGPACYRAPSADYQSRGLAGKLCHSIWCSLSAVWDSFPAISLAGNCHDCRLESRPQLGQVRPFDCFDQTEFSFIVFPALFRAGTETLNGLAGPERSPAIAVHGARGGTGLRPPEFRRPI